MRDHRSRKIRSKAAALAACTLTATLVAAGATPAHAAVDDTERPTAPGPITVVAIDTTSVELTWAASTDNVGVVRYPVGARFEDFGARYSTDTNRIRITDLTMPPGDDQPPSTPGQPVAYDVAATVVRLRWAHSVENVALDRYEVFRVDAGGTLARVREVYQYHPVNSAQVTVTTLPPPPSCAVRSVVRQWSDGFVAHTGRNAVIPPGGTVSLGLVASGTQLPEEVTLNGGLCTVADE
ncbi:hypothetical protein KBX71_18105 [Micromonospora sp. D93]|uniref:hypothetical protein n=1 Tax=Micromonospora sp. D93 TaxID=2824886 RepID=UPI001B384735|nr:hypothetical protein [Micromonospora sp. D93]MBQ1019764.1 hypothetical protein [Micromonospora sp. D93]